MQIFFFNLSLSNYWRVTKYFELVTVTASKPRPWGNMLPKVNKYENVWSNFSASSKVVALYLHELIRFALPNHSFSSISFVPLLAKRRNHELSFSLRWSTFLSLNTQIPPKYISRTAMAFRRDIPPYSLESLQWRPADNDTCSARETL